MVIVYLLQYDCGDYYCESCHVLGVFTSRESAEAAQIKHKTTWKVQVWDWTYRIVAWETDETDSLSKDEKVR